MWTAEIKDFKGKFGQVYIPLNNVWIKGIVFTVILIYVVSTANHIILIII